MKDRKIKYFEIIKVLLDNNINFCIEGGFAALFYLKEHSRALDDLDIFIQSNLDDIEEILRNNFNVIHFEKDSKNNIYYQKGLLQLLKTMKKN